MKRVLFSAVGNTDPMNQKNFHEGPLLHIIRNYKPQKVYVYLSDQMSKYHKEEDRYEKYMVKLAKSLDHEMEIEFIEGETEEIHLFDILFPEFRRLINEIV